MTYPEQTRQKAADKLNDAWGTKNWNAYNITQASVGPILCATIEELHAAKAEIAELVAGVREARERMKGYPGYYTDQMDALLAKHPEPKPDPLLIEAREIAKEALDPSSHSKCGCRDEIDRGEWDNKRTVKAVLAALRRGMEMAREARHDR
jgi:hypothetical protein